MLCPILLVGLLLTDTVQPWIVIVLSLGLAIAGALVASVKEFVHEPYLRGALLTVLTSALLSAPLITFCPVLIKEVFQGDVSPFSLTLGAFGLGA